MLHISQGNRLHAAPDVDCQPGRPHLNGCAMSPQPISSSPSPTPRKRNGQAALAALQQQARIACLGAAG
jgi:hypothetical protein